MSKIGSSADNALAESFNASFKPETRQRRRALTDEREARLTSFRWLHRHNTVRRLTPCPRSGVKPHRQHRRSHSSGPALSRPRDCQSSSTNSSSSLAAGRTIGSSVDLVCGTEVWTASAAARH
jgi:hypothetical protein